ncbi:OmpA family protein [Ulvibacter antarcticus]|uniref:OmpA family protein n=1 Tax=Ulvibacter antarcticus TaxID=442714 RepID=A0A3L9YXI2_9FLAO|nr:OmpA family protein [Ulvibacter antarcticus]
MKKIILLGLSVLVASVTFGQDLPTNPEPGKCYVRCVTPDIWVNQDVTIQVTPAYKKLSVVPAQYAKETITVESKATGSDLEIIPAQYGSESFSIVTQDAGQRLTKVPSQVTSDTETVVIEDASYSLRVIPAQYENRNFEVVVQPAYQKVEIIPAQYETRDVTITVKEASQRLEVIPAEYGSETLTYKKREFGSSIRTTAASFTSDSETIEVKPATARWEMSDTPAAECASSDPNDCRYWCYKGVPAEYTTVSVQRLSSDASFVRVSDCEENGGSGSDCGMSTYTKTTLVRPATTRVIDIPSVTKTVKTTVMVTPPTTRVVEVPEVRKTITKKVMVTPPTTERIEIAARTQSVKKTIISNESSRVEDIPAVSKTFTKTVMSTPPTTRSVELRGATRNLEVTKLVSDARIEEATVPATTRTVSKEVLQTKGGLTTWKEVECALVEYQALPINWNLGSASLTPEAKRIIDTRLMPVLQANPGVKLEIASHTDARGSNTSNQDLSERRASAVAAYLAAKGINNSLLVANGFGENRLKNRCKDGVSCTEREHATNRRTEFRLINNN